jgi:hypothetical protein
MDVLPEGSSGPLPSEVPWCVLDECREVTSSGYRYVVACVSTESHVCLHKTRVMFHLS